MITLVTGGARSGKSTFAENIYKNKEDVVYIATSKIWDKEMEERVKLHKLSRPSYWRTYEGNYNLIDAIDKEKYYLLDCITVMTSNIMFDISQDAEYIDYKLQEKIEDTIIEEIEKLIKEIRSKDYDLVLVTNEVGYSIVPEHHISRVFRDIQGRINQKVASLCDQVYLVACGLPVKLK
ncbi:bifunctional adenosylcobinamide kinase/adenosylcobinamide-phosphate guanylyltransferase [Wansuia hejianensis]|uniref:Adenosylcobinamide kinase n=1 Tax=Wansuia hejianensis TaxID=2763667 RepID=A0A926F3Q2_9FIRM|nr:bifunctional adenosylcobinamide kinase/adenosylcobinamide-phosphate guanylyltransferase [Wansuia hejianensis]MBC8591397.1 bifunctional adenosylcobinamide kinase/adenosylcobinamide-phosphate guanylyltransferase [Wansuia hejianensis]